MKTKNINVRATDETVALLNTLTKEAKQSQSEVIKNALYIYSRYVESFNNGDTYFEWEYRGKL